MTLTHAWQEQYRAALIELSPERLGPRIAEAETAIRQRISQLKQTDAATQEEMRSLDDALRGLQVLERTECKPLSAAPRLATQAGMAS